MEENFYILEGEIDTNPAIFQKQDPDSFMSLAPTFFCTYKGGL